MSESKSKIVQDAYNVVQALAADERELLMVMLEQDQKPGWASPEIEQAWVEECNRRMQLIKEGKAGWVDGEQVLADLRKSITE